MTRPVAVAVLFWACCSHGAAAQSTEPRLELGAHVVAAVAGQFDATDAGLGVRLAWRPIGVLGAEAEVGVYPGDFADRVPFSSSRIEGLFGVTLGPRLRSVRPFLKARGGFLTYRKAQRPFACIAIFPPPLVCQLAAGDTLPSFDLGGGVEVYPTRRTLLRVELGDRAVRYPGLVLDQTGRARNDEFFGHDLRLAIGGGVRF